MNIQNINLMESYIASLITAIAEIYIWNKLLKNKIKFFNIKTILLILVLGIVITLNYLFNNPYLKIICITFFFSLIIKIVYKKTYVKSLSVAIFAQIIMSIGEILFVLLMMNYKTNDINMFKDIFFSKIITNSCISIFSIIVIQILKIGVLFYKIISLIDNVKKKQLIFLLISLLLSINILLNLTFYELNPIFIVLITSVLLLIYTVITLQSINQQENLANIRVEYDQLMDKSVDYEQVLDENKRDLHELKNDFSVLHVLIEKSKEEALKQLDFMVKEYGKVEKILNGTDKYYYKTLKIPSGGLRGLLSTKLKLMEELKINYNLRVGNGINSKMLENTDSMYVRQVGKLLGIYLDNAIAAVKDLKNKNINIEIFNDEEYFNMLISNNLGGVLELDKVGTMGYTTKGNGHGYGLSLAKEILKNNKRIKVNTQITGSVITKIISLKI